MNTFLLKSLLVLLLGTLLSWAYLFMPQMFFSLDNRLRDFMFLVRGELPKSEKVVIIDIDEKSLNEYGQWPWSRDVFAKLLYNLSDAGAGIIGLDIVFAEEDRSSPNKYTNICKVAKKNIPNYDVLLAQSFSQTPVVGGYIFTFEKTAEQNTPMIPAVFVEKGMQESGVLEPKGVVLNIELLQDSLYSSGFFNNTPDEEGMIRSVPLVMKYDGVIYPSLALEMVRIFNNSTKVELVGDTAGVRTIEFGDITIPTDKVGRLLVNFRGKGHHFEYISAADILSGDFNASKVEGKFILVGTSAVGIFDLRSIPFDSAIAGVEIHANAIDNILQGDFLYQPTDMILYDLLMIFTIVIVFSIIFSFIKSWFIIPTAVLFLYGLFELFFRLLFDVGIVLNLLFPLIAYSLTLLMSVGVDYIITSRQKEQAKQMLGKKVSPAVMEYLLKHSKEDIVSSKEVEATIFFSDIRSFTSISEKIGSPDKLIHMLNAYMTPMVDVIIKKHGTIDKFIGDAIMAYWNAPVKVEKHADKAVHCAIEQIEMLQEINAKIYPKYDVTIAIGIGIHTGKVTAGDMGSLGRSDYTVIGDNVNLASRLEGLTKQYGAEILISKATYGQLSESYKIRPIDLVEVKGKREAVEIFEVLCKTKNVEDKELNEYEKATELFRAGELDSAYEKYSSLAKEYPCKLYDFYLLRCAEFLENPERSFTPILTMTTK